MLKITVNDHTNFEVVKGNDHTTINNLPFAWDMLQTNAQHFHILHENRSFNAEVVNADYTTKTFTVKVNGKVFQVKAKDRFDLLLEQLGMSNGASGKLSEIKAPMPGLILQVPVAEGDTVKKGDTVMILEAMKMENIIKSPGDGVIKAIKVKKGDRVEKNQVLITF